MRDLRRLSARGFFERRGIILGVRGAGRGRVLAEDLAEDLAEPGAFGAGGGVVVARVVSIMPRRY